MLCREVMSKDVDWILPDASVRLAACRMLEQDIGFLPVCRDDGTLLGAVTDHDIVVRCVAGAGDLQRPVGEFMKSPPVTCTEDDDVVEAMELMRQQQTTNVLVTDDTNHLRGIIRPSDLPINSNQTPRPEGPQHEAQLTFWSPYGRDSQRVRLGERFETDEFRK